MLLTAVSSSTRALRGSDVEAPMSASRPNEHEEVATAPGVTAVCASPRAPDLASSLIDALLPARATPLAAALLVLAAATARADDATAPVDSATPAGRATSAVTVRQSYVDQRDPGRAGNPFLDESLRVLEPVILFEHEASSDLKLSLLLAHDHVTSASIGRLDDYPQQSGASGDYYFGADGGLRWQATDRVALGWHVRGGFERDYRSLGASFDLTWEDAARATRVSVGVSGFHDVVIAIRFDGRNEGSKPRETATLDLGVYRVLTPWLHAEAGWSFGWQEGFLETNINAVVLERPGAPPNPHLQRLFPGVEVTEELPGRRLRHTLHARAKLHLPSRTVLSLGVRGYGDSWGARSLALEPGAQQWLVPEVLLARLSYRWLRQQAVDHWRRHFVVERRHRTQDPDLGDLEVHTIGGGLTWWPTPGTSIDVGVDRVERSDGLDAWWVTGAVRVEFK